jgi:exopolyphosphatase / guanosine-5'-triphosphate,3'-diphosphate pyrophosphatase
VTLGKVAAVDIGTNSVRLLITDENGRELERSMRITRLGQGVEMNGALHPDAISRTVEVLSRYGAQIAGLGVKRARAVATSAARDASNREAFFDAAEGALGVRPELLSGEKEAELSFRGATAGLSSKDGPFMVVDLGGGSTEFVLGGTRPEATLSLQMGCVRATERHLHSDPPTREQLDACVTDVRHELSNVRETMDVRRAKLVIGLAGTVTALSAMQLGLDRYDASRTHHSILRRADVDTLFARLSAANVEERRKLLVEPERAEVIIGGTVVLLTILHELDIDQLLVSEHDILDGLAESQRTG